MEQGYARILAVNDDPILCALIEFLLGNEGYDVTTFTDPHEAIQQIQEQPPDLLLLDVQLPRMDGFTLMQHVKRELPNLPVVMLTARADLHDRVGGLEGGADDYITKPFEPAELLARVNAVLRRYRIRMAVSEERVLTQGGLQLDLHWLTITRPDSQAVQLTPTEARILQQLMSNPDSEVSREDLTEYGAGQGTDATGNSLPVHIASLRRKLGDDPRNPHYIASVRGGGYRFLSHSAG